MKPKLEIVFYGYYLPVFLDYSPENLEKTDKYLYVGSNAKKQKSMKPITFEFLEKPTERGFDYSVIEYDNDLNLSVDKKTKLPAIDYLNLETETFTKTGGEASDSDADFQMDTATRTLTQMESTDSDANIHSLIQLMGTSTLTESSEAVDSDEDIK